LRQNRGPTSLVLRRSARVSTRSLLCAGTFVVGAKLGEAVPSDLSVV
jgi:hypothetical protein